MATVNLKEIHIVYLTDGTYETRDTLYKLKCSTSRVINYLWREGFSFRVGFRNNILIEDKDYIEVVEDSFVPISTLNTEKYEKRAALIRFLNKYEQ